MCVKEGKIRILNVQFAFRVWGTWAIEWLDECYLGRHTRRKKGMLRMAIEFRVNGSVWPNEMMIIISRIQSQLTPPSSSRSVCRKFIYTSIQSVIHPPQQMPSHLFHFLIIITIIVIKYPPTQIPLCLLLVVDTWSYLGQGWLGLQEELSRASAFNEIVHLADDKVKLWELMDGWMDIKRRRRIQLLFL